MQENHFLPVKYSMGFDFYTASLAFKNFGIINKLVVGDYSLQFGQGLGFIHRFQFWQKCRCHSDTESQPRFNALFFHQ